MAFKQSGISLVIFLLASSCFYGCARPKPGHLSIYNDNYVANGNYSTATVSRRVNKSDVDIVNPFQELVVSLVLDSLDLLPKSTSDMYFDVIMKGIEIPDQDDKIEEAVLSSKKIEDIAYVAGLIVQQVYGPNRGKGGTAIPQAIIYSYEEKVAHNDLTAAASRLSTSQNRNIDSYNACLNLLVNSLVKKSSITQRPLNGVYERDANNNLYFSRKM